MAQMILPRQEDFQGNDILFEETTFSFAERKARR